MTTSAAASLCTLQQPVGLDETTTMMALLKDAVADEEPSMLQSKMTASLTTSVTESIASFRSGFHDDDDDDMAHDFSYSSEEEKPRVTVVSSSSSQDATTAKQDKLIATLRELDERIENSKTELECRQMAGAALQAQNASEIQELKRLFEGASETLQMALGPGIERRSSLHNYVSHIRNATKEAGQTTGASYVVTLEAQVCQSVHRMCILNHQRDLANVHAKQLVEWMHEESRNMAEEQSKVEADLMSRVFDMNCQTRTVTDNYKAILSKQESAIDTLESKVWEAEFNRGNHDWIRQQLEDDQGLSNRKSTVGRTHRRASIGYSDAILRSSISTLTMQRRGSVDSTQSITDSVISKWQYALSSIMPQSQEAGGTNRKESLENDDQVAVEPTPTLFKAFQRRSSIC